RGQNAGISNFMSGILFGGRSLPLLTHRMVESLGTSGRACVMIRCENELELARSHYSMNKTQGVTVIVGTPIHRAGACILDKFLANQKEIQQNHPSSELVLATIEDNFAEELEKLLSLHSLRGQILRYETAKPDYARSRVWNIAYGREAIRQYTLLQTEARYLLFLDADMTFEPAVIEIMERQIQGYDAVFSGYPLRHFGIALAGTGCCMLPKSILEAVEFRCLEFKNGVIMSEDVMLELDLIRSGKRIKKGFLLNISHYKSEEQIKSISPRPVGPYRRITHSAFVRYALIRATMALKRDIEGWLNRLAHRLLRTTKRAARFGRRHS
ncbi:glycosyltransferase family A protein, partial [Chloroflexota bacterium]